MEEQESFRLSFLLHLYTYFDMKIDITDWLDEQLEVVPAAEETVSFEEAWERVPDYEKEAHYDNDMNTYVTALVFGKVRLL